MITVSSNHLAPRPPNCRNRRVPKFANTAAYPSAHAEFNAIQVHMRGISQGNTVSFSNAGADVSATRSLELKMHEKLEWNQK